MQLNFNILYSRHPYHSAAAAVKIRGVRHDPDTIAYAPIYGVCGGVMIMMWRWIPYVSINIEKFIYFQNNMKEISYLFNSLNLKRFPPHIPSVEVEMRGKTIISNAWDMPADVWRILFSFRRKWLKLNCYLGMSSELNWNVSAEKNTSKCVSKATVVYHIDGEATNHPHRMFRTHLMTIATFKGNI